MRHNLQSANDEYIRRDVTFHALFGYNSITKHRLINFNCLPKVKLCIENDRLTYLCFLLNEHLKVYYDIAYIANVIKKV